MMVVSMQETQETRPRPWAPERAVDGVDPGGGAFGAGGRRVRWT